MKKQILLILLLASASLAYGQQPWAPFLSDSGACTFIPSASAPAQCAIDWTDVGVTYHGGIPARTTICSTINASACSNGSADCTTTINSALSACPANETVLLGVGTFLVDGSVNIPSNVTLRGAGPEDSQTVVKCSGTGASGDGCIQMGTGSFDYTSPINITAGATGGSTSLTLASVTGVTTGKMLAVSELNNPAFVTNVGTESPPTATWVDCWSTLGARARGQLVQVTNVAGNVVTISPGLYGPYTQTPTVVVYTPSVVSVGLENLQIFDNNSGYAHMVFSSMSNLAWVKDVEFNYLGNTTSGADSVNFNFAWHPEIRDSYISNAYLHTSGNSDDTIYFTCKSSAGLVENNILERVHYSIMLNWGSSGNVVDYNYMHGNIDQNSQNAVMASISHHGAHPEFNLWEGNVGQQAYMDSVWGTNSHDTFFRNWMLGTTKACNPLTGRSTVVCTGSNGWFPYQAARAFQISQLSTAYNLIGDIAGSAEQLALLQNGTGPGVIPSQGILHWISTSSIRGYDTESYGYTFGYGELSDDGTGAGDSALPFESSFMHGEYTAADGVTTWAGGFTHTLPASFFLSAKPSWWGSLPWPSIGPDITGGTGPGGHSSLTASNPAMNCYLNVMGGSEGGAGSPLPNFNPGGCYQVSSPSTAPAITMFANLFRVRK
jgi:hypothetical protein